MNSAIGQNALEFIDSFLTPEEIRRIKWSKTACNSKDGKRTNKSTT